MQTDLLGSKEDNVIVYKWDKVLDTLIIVKKPIRSQIIHFLRKNLCKPDGYYVSGPTVEDALCTVEENSTGER